MRNKIFTALVCTLFFVNLASAQKTLVIYDPTVVIEDEVPMLPAAEQVVYERTVLPKLKAKYQSDGCGVEPELAGEVSGRFTKKGVVQKLAFYQVCQTGNGLGIVAIVVFENDRLVGIWGDDSGWTLGINTLGDLNANGRDEFALSFGGGLHQGQGGIGVDVMEFSSGKPKSIGWFQGEKIMDTETESAWKVTVKSGPTPVFYRQKYRADKRGKLIKTGVTSAFKLTKVENGFEEIK